MHGNNKFLYACCAGFFMVLGLGASASEEPRCTLLQHFESIPEKHPARPCLRSPGEEWWFTFTSPIEPISNRTQINKVGMPAVCHVNIPERHRNAFRELRITNETAHEIQVGGEGSVSSKLEFGLELGLQIGISPQVDISLSGSVSYSYSTSVTDVLRVYQQDCLSEEWRMFERKVRASGDRRTVHYVLWNLQTAGAPGISCSGGVHLTSCVSERIQGDASVFTQTELEHEISPCCGGLILDTCAHPRPEHPGPCCCRNIH